jgi:hypothetical protein
LHSATIECQLTATRGAIGGMNRKLQTGILNIG